MAQTLVNDSPVTDWFSANTHHPALPGRYEVRNSTPMGRRARMRLIGRFRYWSGAAWFTDETCRFSSVFGEHSSHQWRGVRKWVLATTKSALLGERYVTRISDQRTIHLIDCPQVAMTFDAEAEARVYAARHPRLAGAYALTAVLA
jgi:hypothetical protein